MRIWIKCSLILSFSTSIASAESSPKPEWQTRLRAELGTVGVQNHVIKFGKNGTQFDYLKDGDQDILYPYQRFEAIFSDSDGSSIYFVYQPLELLSTPILDRDVVIDGETFAKDTPMNLRYSFPFYRVSYVSTSQSGDSSWGWGGSLQIRNASINFTSVDGTKRRNNQNIGPVPTLKFVYESSLLSSCRWGAELDTMYAPVKYLNGSDSDVVGAFTDLSLRASTPLNWQSARSFVALRYIGGGASGTSKPPKGRNDGFTSNWIDLISFSLGLDASI